MSEAQGETTFGGCFLAAFRNLAGPGVLLAMGGAMVMNRPAIGSGMDLAFIAVAVINVMAGILFRPEDTVPTKGTGQVKGVSRTAFITGVIALSAVVWGVTHFVLGR